MSLPVRFRNVHYYRVAGKYIFAGDLFIAPNQLYFFPEVDLEAQREAMSRGLPHDIGLLVVTIVYIAQRLGSYKSGVTFWEDGMSSQEFQAKVAFYIESLKSRRAWQSFGQTLPMPTHVSSAELSNIKLTSLGKLSFFAQSDSHDFDVGLRRTKQLRNALWEAGLGRV